MTDKKLKLFFSYGHDSNKEIVNKIKIVLEKQRHHKVWIDTEHIKAGTDWRRKIREGLEDSEAVVAFLSDWSTRDGEGKDERSVCLDELSISVSVPGINIITVLLEPEKNVNVPSTVSRIQWLDMSDWKNKIEESTEIWNAYFNEKMEILISAIESEEHFKFQGEINSLKRVLNPDLSDTKYRYLLSKQLVGREWLSKDVLEWKNSRNSERVLCILAGAGCGKSHYMSYQQHFDSDVVAGYYCEYEKFNADFINEFIRTIAFQMASRVPDYRVNLIRQLQEVNRYHPDDKNQCLIDYEYFKALNQAELLELLLTSELMNSIDGNVNNYIILIDGIDEAEKNGENRLIELLLCSQIQRFPKWIKFLVTCRDEKEILIRFKGNSVKELRMSQKNSENDIRKYIIDRLNKENIEVSNEILEEVVYRSEGVFIYAEKLCDAYVEGIMDIENLDNIPLGLCGLYNTYFRRLFSESYFDEIYDALCVISSYPYGNLSVEILKAVLDWNKRDFELFVRKMKSFIKVDSISDKEYVCFYHKSIGDWLKDAESCAYYVDEEDGINLLHKFAWNTYKNKNRLSNYDLTKTVYNIIMDYGSKSEKQTVNVDLEYLSNLAYDAYKHSELSFSNHITKKIKMSYELLALKERKANRKYLAKAYFIEGEVEICRSNWDKALEIFSKGEVEFSNVLDEDLALKSGLFGENYCWILRNTNPVLADEKIDELLKEIEGEEFEGKERSYINLLYAKGVGLYTLKKYEEAEIFLIKATNMAEMFSEKPKEIEALIDNQLGWCLVALNRHSEACEVFSRSLINRLDVYGIYSRYTALGYDAMARGWLYKARKYDEQLNDKCLKYAEKGYSINKVLFGQFNESTARSMQTIADIYMYIKKDDLATEYAEKAADVFERCGNEIQKEKCLKIIGEA